CHMPSSEMSLASGTAPSVSDSGLSPKTGSATGGTAAGGAATGAAATAGSSNSALASGASSRDSSSPSSTLSTRVISVTPLVGLISSLRFSASLIASSCGYTP